MVEICWSVADVPFDRLTGKHMIFACLVETMRLAAVWIVSDDRTFFANTFLSSS